MWREQKVALSYDVFFSPQTEMLFDERVAVTLMPGKAGLDIRYTVDGSIPTLSSPLYSGPILITETTTIKASTVNDGVLGPVFEARYQRRDIGTALNAPQLVWTTSLDYPWCTQTDNTFDGFAVQSCPQFVNNACCGKTSWLKTTVTGPTELGFHYQKRLYSSSFKVYCDNQVIWTDNVSDFTIGSSYNWNRVMVSLPAGNHEIKFAFEQGWGYCNNFNGIVLDTICFDAWSHAPTIEPATTDIQDTARIFTGSMTITLTPPTGQTGILFYTLDGSDPTQEGAIQYTEPFLITNSVFVQAVFVEPGREASQPTKGYFLERHPVKPGEWTTDVEGVKEAASRDGRLIAVLCANRKGCGWTQRFMPIAESAEFLSWAEANGVYLLTADSSQLVDTEAADDYFWDLYPRGQSASYPTLVFADPKSPNVRLSWGVARNNQSSTIGGVLYKDTVESLARGIAAVMGETFVPVAPTVSPNTELINIFPLTVSLTNTNSSGVIYYTLDGSSLTSENSKQYTGPIIIQNNEAVLCAAVKTASGLFGIPLVQRFKLTSDYVNNCLQTQEIFWMVTGSVGWQESTYEGKPALRTGGYLGNEPYVSTLEAKINGKGKFRFSYKFCNWNKDNTMQFRVNDDVKKNVTWYVGTNYVIETVELEIDGETTLAWTYSVSQPNSDYSNSYSSNGKSAWCGLWLFDVNWMPETISTTTTPVEVPHLWIAEKFPTATPSTYEMLMNDDSDGDGFLNWQEYLCGTDPNSAGTNADSVPHCTIKIVNGLPQVGNNIEIPTAAKTAGWRATTKGSTNLNDWFDADASVHTFFRVVVEQQK